MKKKSKVRLRIISNVDLVTDSSDPSIRGSDKRDLATKKLIKQIVEHINAKDVASEDLWNILTALRGPDAQDMAGFDSSRTDAASREKLISTARLRFALGLRSRMFIIQEGVMQPPSLDITGYHFSHHFLAARATARRLGFKDEEITQEKK